MGGISSGEAVEEPPTAPNACVSPDKDQNRTGSFRSAMRASGEPRLKRNDSKVQFEVEETPPTTYPSPRPKGKQYNPSLFKRSSSSKCAGDCSNLACTARAQSHDISREFEWGRAPTRYRHPRHPQPLVAVILTSSSRFSTRTLRTPSATWTRRAARRRRRRGRTRCSGARPGPWLRRLPPSRPPLPLRPWRVTGCRWVRKMGAVAPPTAACNRAPT